MDKEVTKLIETPVFNKKLLKSRLNTFLANRCFYILKPYFDFLYKNGLKQEVAMRLSEEIFRKVELSIKLAYKKKTPEEFLEEFLKPVVYATELKTFLKNKMIFLEFENEEEDVLTCFKNNSDDFFKKHIKRRGRGNGKKCRSKN